MLLVLVFAYKQAGAERKSDPICRKVGGERICRRPGKEISSGPVQDHHGMRVDGDVLEVFWSYCSEVGFVKVPRNNKQHIWVRGFLLTYIPVQFLDCLVCVGLRGNVNSRDDDRCKIPR